MARGFTLLELLVVIALIGILATVVLASLSESRERAIAAQLTAQFQELEKALWLYALSENLQSWPNSSTGGTEFSNASVLPNFSSYFPNLPTPPAGTSYQYYFRLDYDPLLCAGGSFRNGVNVRVSDDVDEKLARVFQIIDMQIDNGDGPNCGRIKRGGGSHSIYYMIAPNENI